MNKSGLGRSLKYFIGQAELNTALILGGSFVLAVYQRIIINEPIGFSDIMHSLPNAVIMLTYVVLFTTGQSSGQYWYSMLISFGCRRKNVFLGHLAMNILIILESTLWFELLSYMLHLDHHMTVFPLLFAVSLVLEGASKLLGIAMMKWGRIAYTLMICSIVIFCMAFGMFSAISEKSGITIITLNGLLNPAHQWPIIVISILFCIAANMISYCIIKNYEVKA